MKDMLTLAAVCVIAMLSYLQWQQWAAPALVVATPEKRVTPEGSFALVDYVSARTRRGIIGFEPGQMVKFVSADPEKGTLVVTDGTYSVEVKPQQLTNDLDVASLAKRRDQAGQQQLRDLITATQDEDAKIRLAADVEAAKNIGRRPSGATIGSSSSLNKSPTAVGLWQRYPYGSPYYYYYLNRQGIQ